MGVGGGGRGYMRKTKKEKWGGREGGARGMERERERLKRLEFRLWFAMSPSPVKLYLPQDKKQIGRKLLS